MSEKKLSLVKTIRSSFLCFFVLGILFITNGHNPTVTAQQEGWKVELEEGKKTDSTLTLNNRCKAPHTFRIREDIKYLSFQESTESILIAPGAGKPLGVTLDSTGLKPKVYRDEIIVECLDCKKEKTCAQDKDKVPVELTVKPKSPVDRLSSSIAGRVVDPKNNPIAGAEVRAPGLRVALTNGTGEFEIRGFTATERLVVSFSAPGFMETTRIYKVGVASRITGNVVVIWPRASSISLDATRGGKLTFPGGTVSFPPRALVDERGRPIQGEVKVSFSSLDVSDRRQIRSAPGDFTARMLDNRIRQLETFGVFEVFVEDSEGRRADLAKGQKAAVELLIPPAVRRVARKQVGLFSFDKTAGLWLEEGTLQIVPNGDFYQTYLPSLLVPWNADETLNTTCIKLKILNEDNQPAPAGIRVEAEGVDYSGLSPTGYTQSDGTVCLSVKKCTASVRVKAYDPTNAAISSCPVTISTPCHVASAADCGSLTNCPLQPEEIILPGSTPGTFYHDLNAHDPANWQMAHNWTNYTSTDNFYDVWWYDTHVVFNNNGIMRLLLDATAPPANPTPVVYSSGEYRTNATYSYGTYEVCLKAASGPGLMTSFFTYTGPPDTPQHHEIDVEFRGQNTGELWTNFFYDSTDHAQAIQLGFDAAEDFHRYKFVWTQNDIKWYVDGVEKHSKYSTNYPDWPTIPGKIMVNLWCGNSNSNSWLGTFSPSQIPVYAEYDWIRYKP